MAFQTDKLSYVDDFIEAESPEKALLIYNEWVPHRRTHPYCWEKATINDVSELVLLRPLWKLPSYYKKLGE